MTETASPIVTPEAVVLDFETAGVGSRSIAKLLDLFVQLAALFAVVMVLSVGIGSAGGGEALAAVVIAISIFLILFGYPALSETLWNGKTLGKSAMGLRAVTREGAPIRFRHAAVRSVIGLVEVYAMSFIAVLSATISRNNQRVGDLAGGTIVIRERTADRHAVSLAFYVPPGYETYAQSLDVAGLDAEQYRVIRSFLTRVLQLSPDARLAMALRLANPVATQLDHQPPAGIGPELFLVCVAAAYQQRHGGPPAAAAPYGAPIPYGAPGYGTPAYGAPGYGTPAYGAPGYGTPAYGTPGDANPGSGVPGTGPGWVAPPGAAPAPPTAGGYGWGPTGQPPYAQPPHVQGAPPGPGAPPPPAGAGTGSGWPSAGMGAPPRPGAPDVPPPDTPPTSGPSFTGPSPSAPAWSAPPPPADPPGPAGFDPPS